MEHSAKAMLKEYERRLQSQTRKNATCSTCCRALQESVTGNRWTSHGYVCSDCYFEELGRVVEEHPITAPRVPRG